MAKTVITKLTRKAEGSVNFNGSREEMAANYRKLIDGYGKAQALNDKNLFGLAFGVDNLDNFELDKEAGTINTNEFGGTGEWRLIDKTTGKAVGTFMLVFDTAGDWSSPDEVTLRMVAMPYSKENPATGVSNEELKANTVEIDISDLEFVKYMETKQLTGFMYLKPSLDDKEKIEKMRSEAIDHYAKGCGVPASLVEKLDIVMDPFAS